MAAIRKLLMLCVLKFAFGQEDSLRSALNAIDRRQRDLSDYDDNEYGYPMERPEDLAFLKASATYNPNERPFQKAAMVGQPLINYMDDDRYDSNLMKKSISSAFRERVEEDNQKQLEELTRNLLSNMENKARYGIDDEDDYEGLPREYWQDYRRPYDETKIYANIDKRFYYPQFGMDAIGLKKRNRYFGLNGHQHGTDDDDYQLNYLRKRYNQEKNMRQLYSKRFPVTKRSSDYKEENHEQNKTAVKKQTDPKVEKDLRMIFGSNDQIGASTTKPDTASQVNDTNEAAKEAATKEVFAPIALPSEKKLQIKKKSIDWSDYFGLDRRKKSDSNDLDKEWLIERYHKSFSMGTKKRNADESSFRKQDDQPRKDFLEDSDDESDKPSPEEQKIIDIDAKLKIMEDKIVDDALKYTGAHEGDTDPKEIQEVKDKVISRLAAAYSLEKMRNALSEYKLEVAKERERLKNRPKEDDYAFLEKKRTSVSRKQANEKENVQDADNNIKCANGNENCHEQNYKTPSDILENHFGIGECPAIQRACGEIASAVGQYGHVFKSACGMHQICLLCSNNSWFSPTRQCNTLFLAKAYELCKGNLECQREAQRSIRYLLDVSRSLHSQLSAIDDCELSCPETDVLMNPSDT